MNDFLKNENYKKKYFKIMLDKTKLNYLNTLKSDAFR